MCEQQESGKPGVLFFLLPCATGDAGLGIDLCLALGIENALLDRPSRNPEYSAFFSLCSVAVHPQHHLYFQ